MDVKDRAYLKKSLDLILFDELIPAFLEFTNDPEIDHNVAFESGKKKFSVDHILFLHSLLKRFWEEFKAIIFAQQVKNEKDFPLFFNLRFFNEIGINFYCTNTDNSVHFYPTTLDSIRALQNLIEGTPIEFFKKCKDTTCGKCFIVTSDHKREFCIRKCAARNKQREEREERSEKFNKYHRNYYRIKKGLPPIE